MSGLGDRLRALPVFSWIGKRLAAERSRLFSDGVPVDAARAGSVSPLRALLNIAICLCALLPVTAAFVRLPDLVYYLAWFVVLPYCIAARVLFRGRFSVDVPEISQALQAFLVDANLCHVEKGEDGTERVTESMRLRYVVDGDLLVIKAVDDVKNHGNVGRLADLGLPAHLGLPLDSMTSGVTETAYTFRLREDRRIQALDLLAPSAPPFSGVPDSVPLTGSLAWRFAKLPHMLIAGGTGGGKSTFIYYLLIEFMRLGDASGGAADVYICDPKNAELASLSHVFGSDHVGVSAGQIAGVVRRCREEMDRRYEYMQDPERFHFGASAFDYGLNPVFLVFDEVAAFKAAADKKTFAEVWENLTQLVLKARAANVFVILAMQQPRADTISTDIRDNLGARVTLGNLSAEGYRMAFGSCDGFKPQSIAERGTGYIMLDGWDAPKPFKAPFADYSRVDYPKELKRLYIAAQRRNGISADTADKDGTAESVSD